MELKNKFDSDILERIKEDNIKPKSRWTFLLKDYVIWAFGVLALLVGSMAVAVIIYLVKNNDWSLYAELSGSLLEFVVITLPYYWILLMIVFVVVINYNLKHTKNGYKYSMPILISSTMIASIVLGALFFNIGLGRMIDDVLGEKVVYYEKFMNPMIDIWNRPEQGRLVGLVVAKVGDCQYQLVDIKRNEWLVDMVKVEKRDGLEIKIGKPMKILGKQNGEFYFVVDRVFYHEGPGRRMMDMRLRDKMIQDEHMRDSFRKLHELKLKIEEDTKVQENSTSSRTME